MAKSEYVLTYRCAFARFFEINRVSFMWLCRLIYVFQPMMGGILPTYFDVMCLRTMVLPLSLMP